MSKNNNIFILAKKKIKRKNTWLEKPLPLTKVGRIILTIPGWSYVLVLCYVC